MPDRDDRKEPGLRSRAPEPFLGDGDPRLARIDSVGTTLRRARESFGEDLRAVAETLKIRYVYLQAIEEERYKDLPGATYAVGFIRTYADYLSLDSKVLVDLFKAEVEGLDRKTELVFPTPVPESRIPGGALILISLLLVVIAYGGWAYLSEEGGEVVDLIPPVPDRLQALVGEESGGPGSGGPESGGPESGGRESGGGNAASVGQQVAGGQTGPAAPGDAGAASESDPEGLDGSSADLPAAAPVQEVSEVPGRALTPLSPDAAGALAPADEASEGESPTPAGEAPAETAGSAAPVPAEPDAPLAPGEAVAATEGASASDGETPSEAGASENAASEVAASAADPATVPSAPGAAQAATTPEGNAPAGTAPVAPLPGSQAPAQQGLTLARLIDSQSNTGAEDAIPAAPTPEGVPTATPGRAPQVYGSVNEDARIVLRARLDSWVQVRDSSDDSLLIMRVLQEGDSYRVPNREGLTLRTGNAGGLEIMVDGRPLGPIGPVGSVRDDIALDPEQLGGRPATQ